MPFDLPNLDDRSFDDLVTEARARLGNHVPELRTLVPGDPAVAFIDVFAFLTESICYRANLIPERQRRAFLNLLEMPLRPTMPGRGIVCIDSNVKSASLPPLLTDGTPLVAGRVTLSTVGDLQSMPLGLAVTIKRPLADADLAAAGIANADLTALHGTTVVAFRPEPVTFPGSSLALSDTLDQTLYLALYVPKALQKDVLAEDVRAQIAGRTLSLALAPLMDATAESAATDTVPRRLYVDAIYQASDGLQSVPLTVIADSSQGLRQTGILRVRLPTSSALLVPPLQLDPQYAGVGDAPPDLPVGVDPATVVAWLRLTCPDDAQLALSYIGVNGVEVVAQQWVTERVIAIGNGHPDQVAELGNLGVDAESMVLEVQTESGWERWTQLDHLAAAGQGDRVYLLDTQAGLVRFGDGVRGMRPMSGRRIRATFRYGGGMDGNLAPKAITGLASGSPEYKVRHEMATRGGVDAESVADGERRIASYLRHRDRAVSAEDFRELTLAHPTAAVARAEVVPGLIPVPTTSLAQKNVPGAVSVFVLPPAAPAVGAVPRTSVALLRDVHTYLKQRTLIGTELYVLSPAWFPLAVTVCCGVLDPAQETQTLRAVELRITEYLWSLAPGGPWGSGWPIGRAVDPRELAAVVGRVPNVLSVGDVGLFNRNSTGWHRHTLGESLEIGDYALPELMGISAVGNPEADPTLPEGLIQRATLADGRKPVPVPVVPDRC